jgi:hypothetical protein
MIIERKLNCGTQMCWGHVTLRELEEVLDKEGLL